MIHSDLRRAALVNSLKPEEYDVYIWLLQAYSIDWISETLGMESRKVRALAANIYKTLEVGDQRELIRHYVTPNKYETKPLQNAEDFAYSMASYTDHCAAKAACK